MTITASLTYFYGEFLSLELEGEVECLGAVAGQRVETGKLGDVKEA